MIVVLIAGAGVLLVLAYFAVALYVADLFTRSHRRRVEGTPDAFGLRYEDVQFRAEDNVILRGWCLDSPGARAAVLMIHDSWGTRADPDQGLLRLQSDYVRRGYHVFAFDLRGRGESSGSRDCLGSKEQLDVKAAIAFVARRAPGLPLVFHGFGLGASLAINAVANGATAEAVIADSPFSSSRELMRYRWPRVPAHLFSAACMVARRIYGADVDALSPIEVIGQVAPTPVLFIHGDADGQVPVSHSLNIAAATLFAGNEVWTVSESRHCVAYVDDPAGYLDRCLRFIEHAVPARLLASAG